MADVRTHSVDGKSLPPRPSRRRPGQMPFFHVVDPRHEAIRNDAGEKPRVDRHITKAFGSSNARIDHTDPRESAA
jgi:hypothetical protein